MLNMGLMSVTFRNLTPSDIIKYCKTYAIDRIERGSDVHVPVGGYLNTTQIKQECEKNGVLVSSYGTYYRCGTLCNNKENSLKMVKRVNRENFGMYFRNYTLEENCDTLKSFIPILKNVHIFNVNTEGRHSLGENNGKNIWKEFVKILKENEINTNLLFEFLPEQTEDCLKRECEILRGIVD